MVPNRWYAVCEARDVRTKPLALRRLGHDLVLWRAEDGVVRAAADRCPHKGARLSTGRVCAGRLVCPYHGFEYDQDGACQKMPVHPEQKPPQAMRLQTWSVTEAHGLVWLWHGEKEPHGPVPWFTDVPSHSPTSASSALEYPLHYSRVVETNFDFYHFPFVHKSLAWGVGEAVQDFTVVGDGEGIYTRGKLVNGAGRATDFQIDFLPPNLQRLRFLSFDAVIVSTPIDEQRTWVWVRYDQHWVSWPPLGRLLGRLALWVEWNHVQTREDLPILSRLQPLRAGPGVNVWVGADAGAARYVQWRARQLRAAQEDTRATTAV